MIKVHTIVELLSIVLVLVITPYQSAPLRMNTQPADWYGEFIFYTNQEIHIIAKNAGDKPIALNLDNIKQTIVKGFNESSAIKSKTAATIPGESYSLVTLDRKLHTLDEVSESYVTGDNAKIFVPGPLAIGTRSDVYDDIGLCLIVLITFAALSYFVGVYCHERIALFVKR